VISFRPSGKIEKDRPSQNKTTTAPIFPETSNTLDNIRAHNGRFSQGTIKSNDKSINAPKSAAIDGTIPADFDSVRLRTTYKTATIMLKKPMEKTDKDFPKTSRFGCVRSKPAKCVRPIRKLDPAEKAKNIPARDQMMISLILNLRRLVFIFLLMFFVKKNTF